MAAEVEADLTSVTTPASSPLRSPSSSREVHLLLVTAMSSVANSPRRGAAAVSRLCRSLAQAGRPVGARVTRGARARRWRSWPLEGAFRVVVDVERSGWLLFAARSTSGGEVKADATTTARDARRRLDPEAAGVETLSSRRGEGPWGDVVADARCDAPKASSRRADEWQASRRGSTCRR